jgi:predicted Rossmann fold nucleotide-binding protein DprA/Smf involved in DNA uptake
MKACIVTGSRNGSQRRFGPAIHVVVEAHDVVIEGGARGVDELARLEAMRQGKELIEMPADWVQHGKAAGPIRNQQMLDRLLQLRTEGYEIGVAAFHEDLANSKGTGDMVRRAMAAGIRVQVFT